MKLYWWIGGVAPRNVDLGTKSTPTPLYTRRAPAFHLIGGWVVLRAVLDAVVGKKISSTYLD
jgi:hypothetical protein